MVLNKLSGDVERGCLQMSKRKEGCRREKRRGRRRDVGEDSAQ